MSKLSVAIGCALILIWELMTRVFRIPTYLLPPPSLVVQNIYNGFDAIVANAFSTFIEAALGALIGCSGGMLLGAALSSNEIAYKAIFPYIVASNSIPTVAIAPLAGLWFGHGLASKTLVAAFLCFFPIAVNTYEGLRHRRSDFKEYFDVIGATPRFYFWHFRLPLSLPFLVAGAKISFSLAVIGAVVAEFVGSDSGLGFGMVQASYSLNTGRLFAYLVLSCVLGVGFYGVAALVELLLARSRRWAWAFGRQADFSSRD